MLWSSVCSKPADREEKFDDTFFTSASGWRLESTGESSVIAIFHVVIVCCAFRPRRCQRGLGWRTTCSHRKKGTKKTCQRAVIFVDTFLRCGNATVILWQGSSVGQSMRFIPAVSGVQIPPLLPKAIKKSKVNNLGLFYCLCSLPSVRNSPS